MAPPPAFPLTVYFDGACSVCRSKMDSYRHREHGGRLRFVDIAAADFDPAPYGIPLDAFRHEIHAIDRAGRVYRGVAAFRAIWQAFPGKSGYGMLGTLVTLPGVNMLARLAYWSFARLRRFLPASTNGCKNGSCPIDSQRRR